VYNEQMLKLRIDINKPVITSKGGRVSIIDNRLK
jgi:hypothetical protein